MGEVAGADRRSTSALTQSVATPKEVPGEDAYNQFPACPERPGGECDHDLERVSELEVDLTEKIKEYIGGLKSRLSDIPFSKRELFDMDAAVMLPQLDEKESAEIYGELCLESKSVAAKEVRRQLMQGKKLHEIEYSAQPKGQAVLGNSWPMDLVNFDLNTNVALDRDYFENF